MLGLIIMGFGLWIVYDQQSFINTVVIDGNVELTIPAYALVGIGSITCLVSLFGCLGASKEVRCLLAVYFICLVGLLVAQVAIGTVVYINKEKINNKLNGVAFNIIKSYWNLSTEDPLHTWRLWDSIQQKFNCCGLNGTEDWKDNVYICDQATYPDITYPCSCFNNSSSVQKDHNNTQFCISSPTFAIAEQGCEMHIKDWLQANMSVILAVCVAIAVFEVNGFILWICTHECTHVHSLAVATHTQL
uniref:Tetraspanin n=1 Tax=Petromyzon marinus TaxID=7757 RepID=S4RCT4_PETMA